ncbi:MAG: AMIN domain-containing protein [Gammaproteobacteria bacterium]|jgi:N-acetylmuramoyl-L-alanine amidase|nr:AMIN domain-containing protein [Gammaproteobacteria bacterium]
MFRKHARNSLLAALMLMTVAAAAGQVSVDGARIWNGPDHTRFVVDTEAPVEHKVFALKDPHRLVIDLIDARLDGGLPDPAADDRVVAGLRSGIRAGDDLRLVLDLKQPARAKSFNLEPNGTYGHRLVIDLMPKVEAGRSAPLTAASINRRSGYPSVHGARPATRDLVIAVDAGHGGEDPGAIGAHGTREKDVTLAISRKLARRINAHPGLRGVLVRDGDYYIRLRERIEIARKHKADLFVSIHADAFKDRRVRGSSVFTLSAGGATSEAARWLAERENRADLIGGVDLKKRDDILATVLLEMSQNATLELSDVAADKVLAKLRGLGEVHQKRIQKAGFAVLKSPDIPSMLVETAFISNPSEEQRLRDRAYQDRLAQAILDGIIEYFAEYPPPGTRFAKARSAITASERRHRIESGDTLSEIAQSYGVKLGSLRHLNRLDGDRIRAGQVLIIPES